MYARAGRRLCTFLLAGSLSLAAATAQELFSLVRTPFGTDDWTIRHYDAVSGASLGTFGSLSGIHFAEDIAFGLGGALFVCDLGDNRVVRLDGTSGDRLGYIGSFPTLLSPRCVLPTPDGDLLVSSHTRIQRYDASTGAYEGLWGSGSGFPTQMIYGPDGSVYCTTSAGDIERFAGSTGDWLGKLVTANSSAGGIAGAGGLAFGPDGNLYATSSVTGDIRRFDGVTGAPLGVFAASGFFTNPEDLLFGPDGALYVGDRDAIKVYDGETGAFLRYVVQTGDFFESNQRLAWRSEIPEPATAWLLVGGVPMLVSLRRRSHQARGNPQDGGDIRCFDRTAAIGVGRRSHWCPRR